MYCINLINLRGYLLAQTQQNFKQFSAQNVRQNITKPYLISSRSTGVFVDTI